jgi:hypothetical protein
VSVQHRCTVCAKRTIGPEIILEGLDGTTRCRGSRGGSIHLVWGVLILMQDRCTVCVERTTGSEIVLDTPDGSPRWHWSCVLIHLETVSFSAR